MGLSPRVASLVPSGTDIVVDMGLVRHLAGRSHACDHPAVQGLPVLTSPRPMPRAGSPAGPRDPEEALGRPLYEIDVPRLAALQPDLVIARAGRSALHEQEAAAVLAGSAQLVLLSGTSIAGLHEDLAAVGAAMGVKDRAAKQIAAIDGAHSRLRRQVARLEHPRVIALEGGDPLVVAGHWIAELVGIAGGRHALTGRDDPPRPCSWDEIADADPDVLIYVPFERRVEHAAADARALLGRADLAALRAVREGRFWAADAARLFSRLTPAVVTAAPVLASILHPGRFPPVGRRRALPIVG